MELSHSTSRRICTTKSWKDGMGLDPSRTIRVTWTRLTSLRLLFRRKQSTSKLSQRAREQAGRLTDYRSQLSPTRRTEPVWSLCSWKHLKPSTETWRAHINHCHLCQTKWSKNSAAMEIYSRNLQALHSSLQLALEETGQTTEASFAQTAESSSCGWMKRTTWESFQWRKEVTL